MGPRDLHVDPEGAGIYTASVPSHDGTTLITLLLAEAPALTGGRLADDVSTASATIDFLLGHQDAADLPSPVDIADVLAAYGDAVDAIAARRG